MVSQHKLIKNGIRYTDALFEELSRRLEQGVRESDTLESFLENTAEYTTANPLVTSGYQANLIQIILQETNNHKFSRPAQKELTRMTIENYVGDLSTNVGEDIKQSVRDIVKEGYNQGLTQNEIAKNISNELESINNTRARVIARTEIARTATVSDYIINKERGATGYTVDCRDTACDICKDTYLDNPEQEPDGRRMEGDVLYEIDDISELPPLHPNCRCSVRFKFN